MNPIENLPAYKMEMEILEFIGEDRHLNKILPARCGFFGSCIIKYKDIASFLGIHPRVVSNRFKECCIILYGNKVYKEYLEKYSSINDEFKELKITEDVSKKINIELKRSQKKRLKHLRTRYQWLIYTTLTNEEIEEYIKKDENIPG